MIGIFRPGEPAGTEKIITRLDARHTREHLGGACSRAGRAQLDVDIPGALLAAVPRRSRSCSVASDIPATNTVPAVARSPADSQNRAGRRMVLRSAIVAGPRPSRGRRSSRVSSRRRVAGRGAPAVVVDGLPHRGPAGPDQRGQGQQHRQQQARGRTHHSRSTSGALRLAGWMPRRPRNGLDGQAAQPDRRGQREQGGRRRHQQHHRQVEPADVAGSRPDRLHDADLRDLLGEKVVAACGDQDRGQQQRRPPRRPAARQQRVGLPLVGMR